MTQRPKRLVITAGEPAGIGVDICLQRLGAATGTIDAESYVIADPSLLRQRTRQLGLPCRLRVHENMPDTADGYDARAVNVIPVALAAPVTAGRLDARNSRYVLQSLDLACELIARRQADALVTGPVQKSIINEAGIAFTGHTEYLAQKAGVTPVMMLATETMRVALATTHLPLSEVSGAITADSLHTTLGILHRYLQRLCHCDRPRILVCGLNPHAGESGNLGREEIDVIAPVVQRCRQQGMNLQGPLPADTLFTPRYLSQAEAVLAMYHDQGLPVLKYSGFGSAVNVTLGLPYVRTSVDHGTALALAGTGKASDGSLGAAIDMAWRAI